MAPAAGSIEPATCRTCDAKRRRIRESERVRGRMVRIASGVAPAIIESNVPCYASAADDAIVVIDAHGATHLFPAKGSNLAL